MSIFPWRSMSFLDEAGKVIFREGHLSRNKCFALTIPYVSLYLSFQEIDPLVRLVKKQIDNKPELIPCAISVERGLFVDQGCIDPTKPWHQTSAATTIDRRAILNEVAPRCIGVAVEVKRDNRDSQILACALLSHGGARRKCSTKNPILFLSVIVLMLEDCVFESVVLNHRRLACQNLFAKQICRDINCYKRQSSLICKH